MSERYQIQEKIGQGGIGVVYKAFDTQLKRPVALKTLLPADDDDEKGKEAQHDLLKEATNLSAFSHPNIITVFDIGEDDEGGVFVVMELLDGETLDQVIERGPLPQADFERFANQALEGLLAAHHRGLIHRDIKPSNLMITWLPGGKFQVKILDFGLAKFSQKPQVQTMDHGSIFGSIYFMSPEQFERKPLDTRTDIYSMGCIFYYVLAGDYPFPGETVAEVMAGHLHHKATPISEVRPDLPAYISDWVASLMARNPEDRPSSAEEALEQFTSQEVKKPKGSGQPIAISVNAPATPAPPSGKVHVDPDTGSVAVASAGGFFANWDWKKYALAAVVGIAALYGAWAAWQNFTGDGDKKSGKEAVVEKKQTSKPAKQSVAAPSFSDPFDPLDLEKLSGYVGEEITIKGVPVQHAESASGKTRYLNFTSDRKKSVAVAIDVSAAGAELTKREVRRMVNKTILVHGKLRKAFGALEITVLDASQIKEAP